MTTKRSSPCIGYCEYDSSGTICQGCFRTQDEITVWKSLPEDQQNLILQELPLRRKQILKKLYGTDMKSQYPLKLA